MKCSSCKRSIEVEAGWVSFPCPKCGKEDINRCWRCKKLVNVYTCGKCGFEGP